MGLIAENDFNITTTTIAITITTTIATTTI